MGYPELPPEGDEKLNISGQITANFNPPTSEDSDTNDQNADSPYSGYEQLTFDGENYRAIVQVDPDEEEDEEENNENDDTDQVPVPPTPIIPTSYPSDFAEIECSGGGNSFPDVVPVDIELAQQVWSAPAEPSRSATIELDDTRTHQIITLMSGISLPQNCIPEWAQSLPEDKWKQELLDKIRSSNNKPQQ